MKSLIDGYREVTPNDWLAVLTRKGEHAVLLIEHLDEHDQHYIRFCDFLPASAPTDPTSGYVFSAATYFGASSMTAAVAANVVAPGRVRDVLYPVVPGMTKSSFFDMLHLVEHSKKMWKITAEKGRELFANIAADQANPPGFQMAGGDRAAALGGVEKSHNCITWAKEKLTDIELENVGKEDGYCATYAHAFATKPSAEIDKKSSYGKDMD